MTSCILNSNEMCTCKNPIAGIQQETQEYWKKYNSFTWSYFVANEIVRRMKKQINNDKI